MPSAADTELKSTKEMVASTETSSIGFYDEIGPSPLLIQIFSAENAIWRPMNLQKSSSRAIGWKIPV
jgi:hypothetical protein